MNSILVAEDDPVFRRVIVFTLRQQGFDVDQASDGEAAYEMLSQGHYDMLVSDHQMPRCTGLELVERLRNEDVSLPAILCTARGLELDTEGLKKQLGIAEIMHKPFSPRQLAERVGKVLAGGRTEAACVTT